MQVFLRHIPTGHYFRELERWTPDRDEAHDFGLIATALRFAHKSELPALELVLYFESPEQVTAIPFERFRLGLSSARRSAVPHRQTPARLAFGRKVPGQHAERALHQAA